MKLLVTGSAGFIGHHLSAKLLEQGHQVCGIDNMCDYYEVSLKEYRNSLLRHTESYRFENCDLADYNALESLFTGGFDFVIHLAAQAGVRYSIENPFAYVQSNLVGFSNILELCRRYKPRHLIYASSSSVYGINSVTPFSEHHNVDHPVSLYAATKKSNELMAHSYSDLYDIPVSGLRFFTVYGPMGRPDMAYYKFARAIMNDQPIDIYNEGDMSRDFTYVDDIVEGIIRLIDCVPQRDDSWDCAAADPATSRAPYRIYNIGNNTPVRLDYFIEVLESLLKKKAQKRLLPMQAGDVPATCADIRLLEKATGYRPRIGIEEGLERFTAWFRDYYKY